MSMHNLDVKVIDGKLHMIVDVEREALPLKEGKKMRLLASSRGFQTLMLPNGKSVKVSVNIGE